MSSHSNVWKMLFSTEHWNPLRTWQQQINRSTKIQVGLLTCIGITSAVKCWMQMKAFVHVLHEFKDWAWFFFFFFGGGWGVALKRTNFFQLIMFHNNSKTGALPITWCPDGSWCVVRGNSCTAPHTRTHTLLTLVLTVVRLSRFYCTGAHWLNSLNGVKGLW